MLLGGKHWDMANMFPQRHTISNHSGLYTLCQLSKIPSVNSTTGNSRMLSRNVFLAYHWSKDRQETGLCAKITKSCSQHLQRTLYKTFFNPFKKTDVKTTEYVVTIQLLGTAESYCARPRKRVPI